MRDNETEYEKTLRNWNALAQVYQDKFMHLDIYNQSYNRFCELIGQKGASVLEIGCGPGNITRYVSHKRPDIRFLATDQAPAMLELARKNNPQHRFQAIGARNIPEIKEKFEGIICGFVLPYLDKKDGGGLISDCRKLLKPGGILYLSFIEGEYENSKEESSSDGRYKMFIYFYTEDTLKNLLLDKGFELMYRQKISYRKSNGVSENHLILIGRKTR